MEEPPTCSIRWVRKGWHLGCLCARCFRLAALGSSPFRLTSHLERVLEHLRLVMVRAVESALTAGCLKLSWCDI